MEFHAELGADAEHTACVARKARERQETEEAQRRLRSNQHPRDCGSARFLKCSSTLDHDGDAAKHGIGARMFFYTRCVTKGLMTNRTALLGIENPGTDEILANYLPWSGCTLRDLEAARARPGAVLDYDPSYDGHGPDAVVREGAAIVPPEFRHKGPLWWKAQELMYVMRPLPRLEAAAAARMAALGWPRGEPRAGMHVRRTDKVGGCKDKKTCIAESDFHPLSRYILRLNSVHQDLKSRNKWHPRSPEVFISTDDTAMAEEKREAASRFGIYFMDNPVAQEREIGQYSGAETEAAAVDVILLSRSDPLVFAYVSHFAAMAFLLKLAQDDFCSNFASVDLGFRFWPNGGYLAGGGLCRVKFHNHQEAVELQPGASGRAGGGGGAHCELFVEDGRFLRSACSC